MASVPARWPSVAAVPVLFVLTVALQIKLGAYSSEFDYDEASHYVTGLYVHDYLTRALGHSPLAFLREFHSHYPLVGLGHWGPAQYVAEGVWMLAFGASRLSVLLFSATITTATASLILVTGLRLGLPLVIAGLAAGAFVASPIIQQGSDSLMLDNTIALASLLAANAYQAFLARGTWRAASSFALWATVGALVKGNALCLALLPPFALLIGQQWRLVRQPAFWLPVAIVGLVAGPWYAVTYKLVSPGFRYGWGWDYMSVAIPANSAILAGAFGPLILPLGLMGLALVLAAPSTERQGWVAIAALFLAAFLFQIIVPAAIQDRYLAPSLPPLLLLAGLALARVRGVLERLAPPRFAGWTMQLSVLFIVVCALPSVLTVEPKRRFGMIATARAFWSHVIPANPVVLIAADGAEEGAAVAELALGDPARPSAFAVRGSRLLGGGGYNSADYQPRFASPADVMAAIDDYEIAFVLLRGHARTDRWAHVDQVQQAADAAPERWELIAETMEGGLPTRLYRIRGNADQPADRARLAALSAPKALGD